MLMMMMMTLCSHIFCWWYLLFEVIHLRFSVIFHTQREEQKNEGRDEATNIPIVWWWWWWWLPFDDAVVWIVSELFELFEFFDDDIYDICSAKLTFLAGYFWDWHLASIKVAWWRLGRHRRVTNHWPNDDFFWGMWRVIGWSCPTLSCLQGKVHYGSL